VVASAAVSALGATAAVIMVTLRFGWPRIIPQLFLRSGAEGAEYALSAAADTAYNDLDKAMLSHFGMSAANGIYTMTYRVIDLTTMPIASIQVAAGPRLFQLGARGFKEAAFFGRRLLKGGLTSIAAAVGMFLLAPLIPLQVGCRRVNVTSFYNI